MGAVVEGIGDVEVAGDIVDRVEFIAVAAAVVEKGHVALGHARGDLHAVPGSGADPGRGQGAKPQDCFLGVAFPVPAGDEDFTVDENLATGRVGRKVECDVE